MAEKKETEIKLVPTGERRCIWMEAGVVSFKLCAYQYDCSRCEFDKALSSKITRDEKGKDEVSLEENGAEFEWLEKFRDLSESQRKCRHMIRGEVSYKLCANGFHCSTCSYRQMFQDKPAPPPAISLESSPKVSGYYMPTDLYYHRGHSWARVETDGRARIGLDDFASKLVGRFDRVNLPCLGKRLSWGGVGWQIERQSEAVDILSPIGGVVSVLNYEIEKSASNSSKDPYGDGWMLMIEPSDLKENLGSLLYGDDARAWMRDEVSRLNSLLETEIGITIADGGLPVDDIYSNLGKKKWTKFVKEFLLT